MVQMRRKKGTTSSLLTTTISSAVLLLCCVSALGTEEISISNNDVGNSQKSSLLAGFGHGKHQSSTHQFVPYSEKFARRSLTWPGKLPTVESSDSDDPPNPGPPQAQPPADSDEPCIGTDDEMAPAAARTSGAPQATAAMPKVVADDESEEEDEAEAKKRVSGRTRGRGRGRGRGKGRDLRQRALASQHEQVEETRGSQWLLDQCAGRRSQEDREALRSCAKWAVGLEHESMLVHRTEDGLEEYAVNIGSVLKDMALYGRTHGLDRRTHSIAVDLYHTGAEFSGRRCTGVKELNFKAMVESVSRDYRELTFDAAMCQIETIDKTLEDVISAHPNSHKMEDAVGPVTRPRTGMSSELGLYTRTQGKFFTCSSCGSCDLKDYTGSYHVSITLPSDPEGWILKDDSILLDRDTCALIKDYDEEPENEQDDQPLFDTHFFLRSSTSFPGNKAAEEDPTEALNHQWVEAHSNFANMIQWVEPVLAATFGASDSHAVCDSGFYTEGSYRTLGSGWGVPGTTDVRTFGLYGTGRMATRGFDWLFPDDESLAPAAYRNALSNCIGEGMGSDIRVKSKVDEHTLGANETLPPMTIGQGVEIRVFDNFPVRYLPHVYRVISLIAEAGRLHQAPRYIYDDKAWTSAMQLVMKEGWNAVLPKEYVKGLAEQLDLPELLEELEGNTQAYKVFKTMYKTLWDAHSNGMWTGLLLDDIPEQVPELDCPNRYSWELGAINAGITPRRILEIFGIKEDAQGNYPSETVSMGNVELAAGASECGEDLEDMVYLAETYGMVNFIQHRTDGSIESFFLVDEDEWEKSYHSTPVCKANMEIHVEDLWEEEETW